MSGFSLRGAERSRVGLQSPYDAFACVQLRLETRLPCLAKQRTWVLVCQLLRILRHVGCLHCIHLGGARLHARESGGVLRSNWLHR